MAEKPKLPLTGMSPSLVVTFLLFGLNIGFFAVLTRSHELAGLYPVAILAAGIFILHHAKNRSSLDQSAALAIIASTSIGCLAGAVVATASIARFAIF